MMPRRFLSLFISLWLILPPNLALAQAEPALPPEVEINGVSFVQIPAGWFSYSITNGKLYQALPDNAPHYRHLRIWLDSYYMAKYEATAEGLARFLNSPQASTALKQRHVRSWSHGGEAEKRTGVGCTLTQNDQGLFEPVDNDRALPATYLSWNQADAFARWMGFRLPSDAEWQKAARGLDTRIWPWGDTYPDDTYGLFNFGMACAPTDVDAYPKGRSPYGLYNMAGNVSEHVANWYLYEQDAQLQDGDRNPPLNTSTASQTPTRSIRRGGSWSSDPHSFTNAYRRFSKPDRASNRYGARFAIDATQVRTLLIQGKLNIIKPGQADR